MQTYQEIKQLVAETKAMLDSQYKHISLRNYPFEDDIVKVVPTKGLYYSEDYWLDHLFFVTEKGYYFTNEDILGSNSAWKQDDNQPYAEFLKGILAIAKIVKFNEEYEELPKFILNIMKYGRITGTTYLHGSYAGKKHYSYCHRNYSWIGSEYQNN